MYPGGYTAEVTSLPPHVTEKDVYEFFSHCGIVEHIEIIRSGDYACSAYVTFKDAFGLETAVLLSGAMILDERVYIARWGMYVAESDPWNDPSWKIEDNTRSMGCDTMQFVYTPGEVVYKAQEVVKTMLANGFILAKDALSKAKALDESHQVSASASAKVTEFSNQIGLTDTIHAGMETVRYVDEKFHVSDITKSAATITGTAAVVAVTVTGKAVVAAGNAVASSNYFAKGALWVSDLLSRASKAAADLSKHGSK